MYIFQINIRYKAWDRKTLKSIEVLNSSNNKNNIGSINLSYIKLNIITTYFRLPNMYTHVLLSLLACKYNMSIHDLRNDDIHFTYYLDGLADPDCYMSCALK